MKAITKNELQQSFPDPEHYAQLQHTMRQAALEKYADKVVMAYIVMAYKVMVHIVMAHIVMVLVVNGPYSYGP